MSDEQSCHTAKYCCCCYRDQHHQVHENLVLTQVSRDAAIAARDLGAQRIAALETALSWYANEDNYDQDEYQHEDAPGEMIDRNRRCGRCGVVGCHEYFESDRGKRARAALAAAQEEAGAGPSEGADG